MAAAKGGSAQRGSGGTGPCEPDPAALSAAAPPSITGVVTHPSSPRQVPRLPVPGWPGRAAAELSQSPLSGMCSRVQDDVGVLGSQGPCSLQAISALVAATRLSIPLLTMGLIALVSATSVQQTGSGCVGLSTAHALFAAR